MDFSNGLGVEFCAVENRTHDGQDVRVLVASRTYPTDSEDLWDALTDPERIPRWFLPVSGDLQPGGRYQFDGNAGGRILRCDVGEALEVTWEYGGQVSWVHLRLDPAEGGTRLTLEQLIPTDEAAEEQWTQYGPGATGVGWDLSFLGLALHLETGETIDQGESAEWMGSDEGKRFMRRSAGLWAEAHKEAGEAPEVADAMAARTAAGYTGE